MKTLKIASVLLTAGIILCVSCKKKFDLPAKAGDPPISGYIKIDSIQKQYISYYVTSTVAPTQFFRFNSDLTLECIVVADEVSGNLYKTVYVDDGTGGLKLNLKDPGGLYTGDKIRVNLNGVLLNNYGGVIQLDSLDIEKKVVKLSSGNPVAPIKATFNELQTMSNGVSKFQSRLVILDSVQFSEGDKAQPFAYATEKESKDTKVVNAFLETMMLRNSGYSNFAAATMPCGTGSIIAVVSQYGTYSSDVQLVLREYNDVKLSSGICPLAVKTFDDGRIYNSQNPLLNWINYNASGNVDWAPETFNGEKYARITNYSGSNIACETWLISPEFDIASGANPRFSFQSAYNYSGPTLQVLVSTNYTSGNPNRATWTVLSPTLSSGSWAWAYSGSISLASYKSTKTRIAFKYTGTSTSGSTWEVDDIAIYKD